jgi:hypothetical protein
VGDPITKSRFNGRATVQKMPEFRRPSESLILKPLFFDVGRF